MLVKKYHNESFSTDNGLGEKIVPFKGMTKKILSLTIGVHLQLWIDRHYVGDEVQVPEGNSCFKGVDGNAAVCPQHIIHVDLPDSLLSFLLELLCAWSKVCILISEELI